MGGFEGEPSPAAVRCLQFRGRSWKHLLAHYGGCCFTRVVAVPVRARYDLGAVTKKKSGKRLF